MRKKIILVVGLLAMVFVVKEVMHQSKRVEIMTGYASKFLCSCLYTSSLEEERVKAVELGFSPISVTSSYVNEEEKSVTTDVYGLLGRTAKFYAGLGCIIENEDTKEPDAYAFNGPGCPDSLKQWFDFNNKKEVVLSSQQIEALDALTEEAFEENLPEDRVKNTTSLVIIYKGQLITEKYAKGISKNTPLLGWSMAKSLIATVGGMMLKEGKLSLEDPVAIEGWKQDNRNKITYKHMLNMNSGLDWEEDYGKVSDATRMLFKSENMGLFASKAPLGKTPGSEWYYSSGTTNALSLGLSSYFSSPTAYKDYVYGKLRNKIGMSSLFIETDQAGYPVASSYGWATAKDWAKFGQLYLNEGLWNGEQLLDKSWIDFVKTAVPGSEGEYGGHFWLNTQGKRYPTAPRDMFFADGFQGQRVFILPSDDLVIVRTGAMYKVDDIYFDQWIGQVIDVVGKTNY